MEKEKSGEACVQKCGKALRKSYEYTRPTKRSSSFNRVRSEWKNRLVRVRFTWAVGFHSDCWRSCLLGLSHPFKHFLREPVILVILRRLVKHKYQITIPTDSYESLQRWTALRQTALAATFGTWDGLCCANWDGLCWPLAIYLHL